MRSSLILFVLIVGILLFGCVTAEPPKLPTSSAPSVTVPATPKITFTTNVTITDIVGSKVIALPAGYSGEQYIWDIIPSGGTPPYTCSLISGFVLPGTLKFVGCSIKGNVPFVTSDSSFSFKFGITDSKENTGGPFDLSLSVKLRPPILEVPDKLPEATVGKTYTYTFCNPPSNTGLECGRSPLSINPSAGIPPYTFSASSLPLGLSIGFNGALSGTVPVGYREGEKEIEICATDSNRIVVCKKTILPIVLPPPPPPITFTLPSISQATIGVAFVHDFCQPSSYNSKNCGENPNSTNPSGGVPPYTFIQIGGASTTLYIDPTGEFHAAFTTGQEGIYALDICIQDSVGKRACAKTDLTVISKEEDLPSTTSTTPGGTTTTTTQCDYEVICESNFAGSKYSGGHYACYYPQSVYNVFLDCPDGLGVGECCRTAYPGFNFNTANAVCMASYETMTPLRQGCSN